MRQGFDLLECAQFFLVNPLFADIRPLNQEQAIFFWDQLTASLAGGKVKKEIFGEIFPDRYGTKGLRQNGNLFLLYSSNRYAA